MRWKNRPEGSNWGEFGADDELGRVNLLGPQAVLKGIAEVREGLSFCLSLPLDYPGGNGLNPRRHPPRLTPTRRDGEANFNFALARTSPGATDVVCDDVATLTLQYSTQWDALAHVGALFDADGDGVAEPVYYNGFRAGEHVVCPDPEAARDGGSSRARALGVDRYASHGMQGRGVLVDLQAHFGDQHRAVGYDDLMRVMAADGVTVEPGDMLLLRTGFAERVLAMGRQPDEQVLHHSCCALDGRDERLLGWITATGIAALCADNYAVERFPAVRPAAGPGPLLPLHHHCLFKLGLPLGELWFLGELGPWLRERGRHRFLLTAPPLRLPGAVGSPVSPIATV